MAIDVTGAETLMAQRLVEAFISGFAQESRV